MAQLTEQQVKKMLDSGLTKDKIEALASQRGYELPKESFWKQLGSSLIQSEKGFGQSIAGALGSTVLKKEKTAIEQSNELNRRVQTNLIAKIKEKRSRGEDVSRLMNALKTLDTEVNFYDILNTSTGGSLDKSARQVFGEAAGVVTDIAGFGALPGQLGKAAKATKFVSGLKEGAKLGAKTGAIFGGAQGVSRAAQEDKSAGEIIGAGIRGGAEGGIIGGAVGGLIGGASGAIRGRMQRIVTKEDKFLVDLTAPAPSKKVGTQAIKSGRFTEPGLFRKTRTIPTQRELDIADSVRGLVSPKNTLLKNVDSVSGEVTKINKGVGSYIAQNKIPFNTSQLRTQLNVAKAESRLIFASDKTAEKTYNAVVDEFMKHVEKKDTLGLFQARQSFDKLPAIKKLLQTETLGENTRRAIVLDIRRAANTYVSNLLPKGNPYKNALLRETNMLEALSNIADKNYKMIGQNKLQILTAQYPILKWLVGGIATGIAGAAGIGVGSSIISSTD